MKRGTALLVALALWFPGALPAQADSVTRRHDATLGRAAVHYGKWVAAAAAVAFTAMAAHEHDQSNREFSQLFALCQADNASCILGPDGRYLNATAEQLYQTSLKFDRRARTRLFAGQAALLAAAALFIADLRHHTGGPGNIPYAPLEVGVAPGAGGGALVGVRVRF